MAASQEWQRQQPVEGRDDSQVETPSTPHSRSKILGRSHELSASTPSRPRAALMGMSGGGDSGTAAASPPGYAAATDTGLVMHKHLAFPEQQAEAAYRLCNAQCCCLSELSLLGLQLVGWLAAAGRAVEIRCWHIVVRVTLLILAPALVQQCLILYAPATYRRHRCACVAV